MSAICHPFGRGAGRFRGLAVAAAVLLAAAMPAAAKDRSALTLEPARPLVFVPGLLGSRLCRPDPETPGGETVVWGTLAALRHLPSLAMSGGPGNVRPCGLIREVGVLGLYTQEVYAPFVDRLAAEGYREGETLHVFDYDWRLSVLDNAARLADFVETNVPEGRFDVLGHSMGGIVARTYAIEHGGAARIDTFVTAGTPWRGSVRVVGLVEKGWGFANVLFGGLPSVRATILSFPVMFELMADYEGCCGPEGAGAKFDAFDAEAWLALEWDGVTPESLPDFAEARARRAELRRIAGTPLPASTTEVVVIGVDQRTPSRVRLDAGEELAHFVVETGWAGDGTVMRDSAALQGRPTYRTSFATHDTILNDADVQDFVVETLARGPEAALRAVPVRERGEVRTALGRFVELVGAAVATDQPAYAGGQPGRATVHLRPATMDPVDLSALRLTLTRPDGSREDLRLAPDPSASDPTNPFEQSFSAAFDAGGMPGGLRLRLELAAAEGATPRIVRSVVPVVAD